MESALPLFGGSSSLGPGVGCCALCPFIIYLSFYTFALVGVAETTYVTNTLGIPSFLWFMTFILEN